MTAVEPMSSVILRRFDKGEDQRPRTWAISLPRILKPTWISYLIARAMIAVDRRLMQSHTTGQGARQGARPSVRWGGRTTEYRN
ncbi:hypothetical protein K461DRAFT_280666 [Myriangium duriaei CBS 260.36]|uniref:Uncharacterized protein n=1 Tax=Myriangium duriaei CBS 260.36 TaxID=1168546 RepID=A0A9P4IY87_9PEZI|nr:hypothetical protein K461DRAFT_280666 [Myriangium duriaei CBS 260.36]